MAGGSLTLSRLVLPVLLATAALLLFLPSAAAQSPGTTTTVTPSADVLPLGESITATVDVTENSPGPAPTGTVELYLCTPAEVIESGGTSCSWSHGTHEETLHVDGSGPVTSLPTAPHLAGRWCFSAIYSGDETYPVQPDSLGGCFDVEKGTPTLALSVDHDPITLGETKQASVSLSWVAEGAEPTGTVTFSICRSNVADCWSTQPEIVGTVGLVPDLNGLVATSPEFTPQSAESWCVKASYSGDANYEGVTTDGTDCFQVDKAAATVTESADLARIRLGESNTYTFSIEGPAGVAAPTGWVTSYVCGSTVPAGCDVTGPQTESLGTIQLDGSATYASPAYTPPEINGGNEYCFHTVYDGDGNYAAGGTPSYTSALCFVVDKPLASLTSQVSTSSMTFGQSVTDAATISGDYGTPTGTVTFWVCEQDGGVCPDGASVVHETVNLNDGLATSSAFEPTSPGTWCFEVEYSGDGTYDSSRGPADADCFEVLQAPATATASPALLNIVLGEWNHDEVTVTSTVGRTPGGQIEVWWCPLEDFSNGACGDESDHLGAAALASGAADGPQVRPPRAGHWCFQTRYGGDEYHSAATATGDHRCFYVGTIEPTVTAGVDIGTIALGDSVTESVDLSGPEGVDAPAGGELRVYHCKPTELDGDGVCSAGGSLVLLSTWDGSTQSAAETPSTAGSWCFRIEWDGDDNYDAHRHFTGEDCADVLKGKPTVGATVSYPSVVYGETNTVSATVTGIDRAVAPTGTVSFRYCAEAHFVGSACSPGRGHDAGFSDLADPQPSTAVEPDAAGRWCFEVLYNGDLNYEHAWQEGDSGCFTVSAATPTVAFAPSTFWMTLGETRTSTVSLSGAGSASPTGYVNIFVCRSAEWLGTACADETGRFVDSPALAQGSATSGEFLPDAADTWCFEAVYWGDSNYTEARSTDGAGCFGVDKASPTFDVAGEASSIWFGDSIRANLELTGPSGVPGPSGGILRLHACGPSDLDLSGFCSSGGSLVDEGTYPGGPATSTAFLPDAAGEWCLRTYYDGDDNYQAGTSLEGCFTVEKTLPSSVTVVPAVLNHVLGESNSAGITIAGPESVPVPTGTVTAYACHESELWSNCSETLRAFVGSMNLASDATAEARGATGRYVASPDFFADRTGWWCFEVVYSGDDNYEGAIHTECWYEVDPAWPSLTGALEWTARPFGGENRLVLTVVGVPGAATPSGWVELFRCHAGEWYEGYECGASSVGPQAAEWLEMTTLDSYGEVGGVPVEFLAAGVWCFHAIYYGDDNYHEGEASDASWCFTVDRAEPEVYADPWSLQSDLGEWNALYPGVEPFPGGPLPSGTVELYLCVPATVVTNGGHCATGGDLVQGVELADGSVRAYEGGFLAGGTWCARAVYSGDLNYNPAASPGDACVEVLPVDPYLWASVSTAAPAAGAPLTVEGATNPVEGAYAPSGSGKLFGCFSPEASPCGAADADLLGEAQFDANGRFTLTIVLPLADTWCFWLEFPGDSNYEAATVSTCAWLAPAAASVSATVEETPIALGGSTRFGASLSGFDGGPAPGGTVRFVVCDTFLAASHNGCPPEAGGAPVEEGDLTGGSALSAPFFPTSAGKWCVRVDYDGDATYGAGSSKGVCFTVARAAPDLTATPLADTLAFGETFEVEILAMGLEGGPTPGGSVTFHLCDPGAVAANGGHCDTGGKAVSGVSVDLSGGSATATGPQLLRAGTWCFRAKYGGDMNYLPAVAAGPTACVVVEPGTPNLATRPSKGEMTLGGNVRHNATLGAVAGFPTATGEVAFFACDPATVASNHGDCASGGTTVGTATLRGGGADSPAFAPMGAGLWCFRTEYLGDANYVAVSDSSTGACFRVYPARAVLTSTPSLGSLALGGSVVDLAGVAGLASGPAVTGKVQFFLCDPHHLSPAGQTCASGGQALGERVLGDTAEARSAAVTPSFAGRWCFRAEYLGDANYAPGVDASGAGCFEVTKGIPRVTTSAEPAAASVGREIRDVASVAGLLRAPGPSGVVEFFLCRPSALTDGACPTGGMHVGTGAVGSDGRAASPPFVADEVGVWCWRAEYAGDANYSAVDDGEDECVTVAKGQAGFTTAPSARDARVGGEAVRDRAVLSGPSPATGTVKFYVCRPGEAALCATGGRLLGEATLVGGEATSPEATFDAAGLWCFRAEYGGDARYEPAVHTSESECVNVGRRSLLIVTTPDPPKLKAGEAVTDRLRFEETLPNVPPTGTVRFWICNPTEVAQNGGSCKEGGVEVGTLDLSTGAVHVMPYRPREAGTWCFRAAYSGDATYEPAVDSSTRECVVVDPAAAGAINIPSAGAVLATLAVAGAAVLAAGRRR